MRGVWAHCVISITDISDGYGQLGIHGVPDADTCAGASLERGD
jgi:hypothetical protein